MTAVGQRGKPKQDLLKGSENLLNILLDGIVDYACCILDPNGFITTWNARLTAMTGFDSEDVIGAHFSIFYPPEERARGVPEAALARARQFGGAAHEVERMRKDGVVYWADVVIDPVRDDNGQLAGFVEITRDITQRREEQRRLAASERSLRLMVDGIRDHALCLLDPAGLVTTWNAGSERLRGYKPAEIIGKNYGAFYTEEARARGEPEHALATARAFGKFESEGLRVRSDGTRYWTHATIEAIVDEHRQLLGYSLLSRDISEQRETEQDKEILSAVFRNAPDGMAILDSDLKFSNVNSKYAEMHGWAIEELFNQSLDVVIPEANREAVRSYMHAVLAGDPAGAKRSGYTPLGLRRDGTEFRLEAFISVLPQGDRRYLVGIVRDITDRLAAVASAAERERETAILEERARSAETLRRTSEMLERVIEASPVGIFGLYGGETVICNSAARRIYGLEHVDRHEIGQLIDAMLTPPGALTGTELLNLVRTHGAIRDIDVKRRRTDGSVIELSVSGAALHDDHGDRAGYVYILDDVTSRKQLEAQLRQSQKMEAIGQLTGGVAHDFNNLLAIIQGNLELLQDEIAGNLDAKELVGDALTATARGASLTHRLLVYSRLQPMAPAATDLTPLLKSLFSVLRRVLEASIRIEMEVAPNLMAARIDSHQLENALLNLAVNSRDAMPDGGKLTISAENVVLDDEYCARNADVLPGRYVMIAIRDTGAGMSPEVADRILEPFYTTKPVGKGTGLGLSMVYGFVKQSGGHLKIESEIDRGTCVSVYLPQTESEKAVAVAGGSSTKVSVATDKIVLVVEDDPSVRRLQIRFLKMIGYMTLEAEDGATALALIEHAPEVDVLLTDMVMPGSINGTELYRQALKFKPKLKAVFMSGYASKVVIQSEELCGFPILSKPFTREALAETLERVILGEVETSPGPDRSES